MQRVSALIGPTAVGKTAVAVELAQALGAEIVSCDSMQVYRRMTALTQCPTHAQRAQVQHHLVDFVDPTQPFSVGEYRRLAGPIIERLLQRGKRVLITGGTGLYLRALTEGLCDAPPADVRIREQLWTECHGIGSQSLYNRLMGVDLVAASHIHPNDARRIIRALEVFALTGRPISTWWRQASQELLHGQVTVVALTRDRDQLYQRINERLLHMIYEQGVINEVRELLRLPLSKTARQVHGLADIEQYLAGRLSLQDTIALWQQRVRNYAKRQLTWFRSVPNLSWVDIPDEEPPWETSARILDVVRAARPQTAGAGASHVAS